MIFDAHLHLPCYDGCLSQEDKKARLLTDLAAAGVYGGVVIADSILSSPIGTTEECVDLFAGVSNIFVMAGISPLIDYTERLSALDKLLSQRKIIALKLYPGHEAFYMDDDRLFLTYELCEKYDVPLAVHTGWDNSKYNQPHFFESIAKKHPALKIVVCHLYYPDINLCFEITSQYRNIYYDISSLAHNAGFIERASSLLQRIAASHADRIIFGSDYGACSIQKHINLVHNLDITHKKKQMIFSGNALTLYNISANTPNNPLS